MIKVTKHNFDINAFSTNLEQERMGIMVNKSSTMKSVDDIDEPKDMKKE